jgi:YD repeat-containing protein
VSGLPEAFDQRIDGVDTATDLTWDAAGRLESETTGGVLTEYGYDQAGQLLSVVRDGAGGGDDEAFTYDDLGRRLTQVDGAGTTTFAYDSGTGELASMTHQERPFATPVGRSGRCERPGDTTRASSALRS